MSAGKRTILTAGERAHVRHSCAALVILRADRNRQLRAA